MNAKMNPIIIVLVLTVILLMCFFFNQCHSNPNIGLYVNDQLKASKDLMKEERRMPISLNKEQMDGAFEKAAEIGSGRNFLTLMVDLGIQLPPEYRVYALILDKDKFPVRKIGGFTYNPGLEGKNHYWFYFFLYAPSGWRFTLPKDPVLGKYKTDYVQFIIERDQSPVMDKIVEWNKIWGDESSTLIADLPAPPDEIRGYLVLKDYTFLAIDDYREPDGYYIEGKIIGKEGEWKFFVPGSNIKGNEPDSSSLLPSDQGWLELSNGKSHSMKEAVSPLQPYVEGWWDGDGYFHPRPLRIN